ncbi:hypothetical protein ACX0G7_20410 [Flavitalea antarctica]
MYNKIRMGIMLACFTFMTIVGLSYSGKVSDGCRSEWEFGSSSTSLKDSAADHANSPDRRPDDVIVSEDKVSGDNENNNGFNPGNSVGQRLSDFDLIFPNFLFAL